MLIKLRYYGRSIGNSLKKKFKLDIFKDIVDCFCSRVSKIKHITNQLTFLLINCI